MSRCETLAWLSGGEEFLVCREMARPAVVSFLLECHISVSQEEVLANVGGGWERSGLYSLDETPSQNFLYSCPRRVQQNSLNVHAGPPASRKGDSGSESSESLDEDGDMAFTQGPVEWMSSPSSLEATGGAGEDDGGTGENDGGAGGNDGGAGGNDGGAGGNDGGAGGNDGGAEGNDGGAGGNDGGAREDSYVAAFESNRSQSPSQDWHGQTEQPDPEVQIPNLGLSAHFLTQPISGVVGLQFASSEDLGNQIPRRETIPQLEFQDRPLVLPPIPKNAVSVVEAHISVMESRLQPFTQPLELLLLEPFNKLQESASETESESGGNETVHDTTLLDRETSGAEDPEPVQRGSGPDELVNDAPALVNHSGCTGEHIPQEMGGDEHFDDSQLPVDDGKDLRSTEHMQQEHESHVIINNIPYVEVQRGDPGLSDITHPPGQISKVIELWTGRIPSDSDQREQMQRSNGSSPKALKRVNCAEELHGRQKRQRVKASPVRARSFPQTVMDVVRSRSRPLSNSLVDDECDILSIIMRAGAK